MNNNRDTYEHNTPRASAVFLCFRRPDQDPAEPYAAVTIQIVPDPTKPDPSEPRRLDEITKPYPFKPYPSKPYPSKPYPAKPYPAGHSPKGDRLETERGRSYVYRIILLCLSYQPRPSAASRVVRPC